MLEQTLRYSSFTPENKHTPWNHHYCVFMKNLLGERFPRAITMVRTEDECMSKCGSREALRNPTKPWPWGEEERDSIITEMSLSREKRDVAHGEAGGRERKWDRDRQRGRKVHTTTTKVHWMPFVWFLLKCTLVAVQHGMYGTNATPVRVFLHNKHTKKLTAPVNSKKSE